MNAIAAGGAQLIDLGIVELIVSRNPGVSDQPGPRRGGAGDCNLGHSFWLFFDGLCTDNECMRKWGFASVFYDKNGRR
ncbi:MULTISPECIES: hypothetical protein [Rhizobium]|uniref:Uncharacterized protein n=1 Tax=Rhizobium paranaense TaxID=1650438 RepID=A0A7W9D3D8_9HYPH|nr:MULTISPECIES: hypothetical protein [Rhizobium]MBB5576213.1 hypothetical protein [Rhizobium paranaense]MBB6305393.1 hypothetical protein [Rhizobium leucaenae]MDK4743142.1 hypothetical protein [Rhizobium sp. CNPSo 3464]